MGHFGVCHGGAAVGVFHVLGPSLAKRLLTQKDIEGR